MSATIQLEWTPNPNTLKYVIEAELIPRGAMNFRSKEEALEKSPLVIQLFGVPGVAAVMLGKNFVTVTKGPDGDWDELNDGVMQVLEKHVSSNAPAVTEAALAEWAQATTARGGDIEQLIRGVLEEEIRPAVAMDGGDITFDRFEDGTVYVHMQGSCAGCPSSTATLRLGIESRLRELIPDLVGVVPVEAPVH